MKITISILNTGPLTVIQIEDGSPATDDTLAQEIHHMAQDMEDLKAEVANTATVEQSAIAMIQGLEDRLSAIIPPTGESVDPADLVALRDQLASSREALAAAITSGTSADTSGADTGTTDTTGTGDAGAPTGTATGTATDTGGGDAGAPASTATDTGSGDSGNAAGGDGSSAGTGDGSDAGGDVQPPAGIDTTVDQSANDQVVDDQSGGGGE